MFSDIVKYTSPKMVTKFSTLVATMTVLKSAAKPHRTLEQELDSAQRAELPSAQNLRKKHEYGNLLQASHGNEIEDGVFICCCGAENKIVHFVGAHPFKFINCRVCNHTFCSKCNSSEVLTPIKAVMLPPCQATPSMVSNLGQICADCGLTHRVTLTPRGLINENVLCHCGSRFDETWIMFGILSPDKYRYDPNAAYVKLKAGRAAQAAQDLLSIPLPQAEYFNVLVRPCTLKRSNAVHRRAMV
jgi:hypothetical protein